MYVFIILFSHGGHRRKQNDELLFACADRYYYYYHYYYVRKRYSQIINRVNPRRSRFARVGRRRADRCLSKIRFSFVCSG